MKQIFNIGVIGGGMYGKVHIRWFQAEGRAEVGWVCNRRLENAQQAAEMFNIPRYTVDYREILTDPEVDAVVIAAPPYLHREMLEAALEAGKHVLIEKPMVARRAELADVLRVVQAHPELVVLEASCRHTRLQPKFYFIKGMIESGKLGQIYHIHHNHLNRTTFVEYNPAGTWGVDRSLAGGGPFIDWGVYDLSFHLGLLDDKPALKSVRSFKVSGLHDISDYATVSDVEQHGAAWMEFDTGLTYYYERGAGVHADTDCETRIYGTEGGLRFHFPTWESNVVEYFYEENGEPKEEIYKVDMSGHAPDDDVPLVAHFLDCLEGNAKPLMPVELAAKHMEILFRILDQ